MIYENLLRYRKARYLWWAIALAVVSVVLFATQSDTQPASGGTWQGYTLGTIGALLIVWLGLLGIRKRRYASSLGTVQGWASAHIYLGAATLIVATLHSAAQLGWNVHTLAWALMLIVILSGFFGVYTYMAYPRLLSANRGGEAREKLFADLYELNDKGRALARQTPPEVAVVVDSSIERTSIGGGVLAQLFGVDHSKFLRQPADGNPSAASATASNRDQQAVIDFVAERIPRSEKRAEAANLQALLSVLCRRQAVLRRIRRDIRMQSWLQTWLYIHVPLTLALLGALVGHIISTFLYW
ncbi:MAG: hypothetical protein ACREVN_12765 [Gammaproteobacteria bacterium]